MSRTAVEQLLYLMDEAFEDSEEHSLTSNLRTVTAEDWLWVPPQGRRCIREIVGHVGACKYMYDNHAFGDARMTWDDPIVLPPPDREPSMSEVIEWMREGHRRLRQHVVALDDDELLRLRRTNWGDMRETRWIIATMIEHDLYHAGEINHIRALLQENDRWAWESS